MLESRGSCRAPDLAGDRQISYIRTPGAALPWRVKELSMPDLKTLSEDDPAQHPVEPEFPTDTDQGNPHSDEGKPGTDENAAGFVKEKR